MVIQDKKFIHFSVGRQAITIAVILHSMQKSPSAHKQEEVWDVATRETVVHCRKAESCPTVSGLPQQLSAVLWISFQRELECTWGQLLCTEVTQSLMLLQQILVSTRLLNLLRHIQMTTYLCSSLARNGRLDTATSGWNPSTGLEGAPSSHLTVCQVAGIMTCSEGNSLYFFFFPSAVPEGTVP